MNKLEGRWRSGGVGHTTLAAGTATYFLIFSRMSAILPKRFCVKKKPQLTTSSSACQTHRHTQEAPVEIHSPEFCGPAPPLLGLRLLGLKLRSLEIMTRADEAKP